MDYKETNNFNNVKVGDEVWSPIYGIGNVSNVRGGNPVTFCVDFPSNYKYYDVDSVNVGESGILVNYIQEYPSLYWQKPDWWQDKKYPAKKIWRAGNNQNYYFIDVDGTYSYKTDTRDGFDDRLFSTGNYFETKEEAKSSVIWKAFHPEEV